IDECAEGSHNYSLDAFCNNTKGSYNCTCKQGFLTLMSVSKGYTTAVLMPFATTLKGRTIVHVNLDPLEMAKNAKETFDVEMEVRRQSRLTSTFHYGSSHWSDYEEYNFPGEKTGFEGQETKLPTYWNTPFA
ncbi:hypothetical protein pdam_00011603, partial [Pocillopora damicornis]